MNKPIPISIGERHGTLTVIREEIGFRNKYGLKRRMYHVLCDCGEELMLTPTEIKKKTKCSRGCVAQMHINNPLCKEGEVWKPIKETSKAYLVSNYGRVWSCRTNRIIAIQHHSNGYCFVQIKYEGEVFYYNIARLVAKHFVDNPYGYLEVNHKDENKDNNCADNLEWCTRKYNCNYGERNTPISRRVIQCDANGNDIIEYKSARDAMRKTGVNQADITRCCQGKRRSAKGTYWKYKDERND